jgi:hypothetical protein
MNHSQRKYVNPFYVLLLLVGIVFTVTATAYVTMTAKMSRPEQAQLSTADGSAGIIDLIDRHGAQVMMIEIAILAVVTAGAIATDQFWAKRALSAGKSAPGEESAEPHRSS